MRTRLFDAAGQGIEIIDFAPRFFHRDRMFRPAQLVRRVRPLAGHPRMRIIVRPRGDWGARDADDHARQQSPALRAARAARCA